MHFCSKPVFNICDQTCQAGTDEEKRTKVLGEDRREGKLPRTQMLTVAVMQAMQQGIEPWSQDFGSILVHKLHITKTGHVHAVNLYLTKAFTIF